MEIRKIQIIVMQYVFSHSRVELIKPLTSLYVWSSVYLLNIFSSNSVISFENGVLYDLKQTLNTVEVQELQMSENEQLWKRNPLCVSCNSNMLPLNILYT